MRGIIAGMNSTNSQTQHTPGPWAAFINPITGRGNISLDPHGSCKPLLSHAVSGADARLIAAAPELLEVARAFEAARELWIPADCDAEHSSELMSLHVLLNKVTAAIAKAEGNA